MPLREHRQSDIREIEDRLRVVADGLAEIRKEMSDLKCDSIEIQSESIVNHRLLPIEDWLFRVKHQTEKIFRKLRREREAFQLGQQYAASKSAEKPQKTPGKRKK